MVVWDRLDFIARGSARATAPEDMTQATTARADEFESPNQKTAYNNLNFVLLGEIVGKVSGTDLGTRISQRIFEPLSKENSLYPTNNQLPGELHWNSLNSESDEFEDKTTLPYQVQQGPLPRISPI